MALTDSWQVLVSVGAALEAMIYVVAGFCVLRLRDREPEQVRPFRLWAGKPLAVAGMVVFAVLAVGASVSVNNRFDPLPLGIIAIMAAPFGGLCPRLPAQVAGGPSGPGGRRDQAAPAPEPHRLMAQWLGTRQGSGRSRADRSADRSTPGRGAG